MKRGNQEIGGRWFLFPFVSYLGQLRERERERDRERKMGNKDLKIYI